MFLRSFWVLYWWELCCFCPIHAFERDFLWMIQRDWNLLDSFGKPDRFFMSFLISFAISADLILPVIYIYFFSRFFSVRFETEQRSRLEFLYMSSDFWRNSVSSSYRIIPTAYIFMSFMKAVKTQRMNIFINKDLVDGLSLYKCRRHYVTFLRKTEFITRKEFNLIKIVIAWKGRKE